MRSAVASTAALAITMLAAACGGHDDGQVDAAPSAQHVSGHISYEDRAQTTLASRTFLAPAVAVPARRIEVAVFAEGADEPLAMGTADETGAYSLDYLATTGAMVHITAIAESAETLHPVKVTSEDDSVHAFGGAAYAAGTDVADVLVTEESMEAQAFNIFDNMQIGFDKLNSAFAQPTPLPLTVRWYPGNMPPGGNTTHYVSAIQLIDIEGYASDDDGYDDDVMMHEFGHYVSYTQAHDDNPGGNHNGTAADARLAWSEGWATYWEMFVYNVPLYIDTNTSGGFFDSGDTDVETATLSGPLDQNVNEGMITQILWDLGDSDAGVGIADDDPYAGGHLANVAVLKDYLKTATLRNVGKQGVDLLDFLDGWFIENGLTDCAAVKSIVVTTHQFPYDFAGPGGSCP